MEIAAYKKQIQHNSTTPTHRQDIDFSLYKSIFSDTQLNELQNCNQDQRSDSLFIATIIKFIYGDSDVLNIPTLRRRVKHDSNQEKVSPEIMEMFKSMMTLRLDAVSTGPAEYLYRFNRINSLVSQALLKLVTSKNRSNPAIL